MISALAAGLAVLAFSMVPGVLVYRLMRPRGPWLECVAVAPALSLALVFVFGEVATLAHLPFAPGSFAVVIALLVIAVAYRLHGSAQDRAKMASHSPLPDLRSGRLPAALLALAILLSAGTWVTGLREVPVTPPNRDSANHGFMVARVASLESMDVDRVLVSDGADYSQAGEAATAFYPLTLHGQVALVHRSTGVAIADGLLATTLLFAAFVFPVGMFLLVRTLAPERPLVAGMASVLVSAFGLFPFQPIVWGGMALIVGLSMVPAVVVAGRRYLVEGGGPGQLGLTALACVGIFATHPSELPLLMLFVGLLVIEAIAQGGGVALLVGATRRTATLGVSCLLLLLPVVGSVASGAAERSTIDERPILELATAIGDLWRLAPFNYHPTGVVVLALLGVGLCLRQRRHLALVGGLGTTAGLYVLAAASEGTLRSLTTPWYHQSDRIVYNFVLFLPVLAALALSAGANALDAAVERYRISPGAGTRGAVAVVVLLGLAGSTYHAGVVRQSFQNLAVADDDAVEAFSYLRSRGKDGQRVLNDINSDGGLWMYAFAGVAPALALEPAQPDQGWQERLWLLDHLDEFGKEPKVAALLERYGISFVYLNERVFPGYPHLVSPDELRSTPGVCERFHQGTSHVFEIGRSCRATPA